MGSLLGPKLANIFLTYYKDRWLEIIAWFSFESDITVGTLMMFS